MRPLWRALFEAAGQRASEASEDRGSARSRKPPKAAPHEAAGQRAIHLDSALAKAPPDLRARIADPLTAILRRPVSLARALRITVTDGEPWSLPPGSLADWAPAGRMAGAVLGEGGALAFEGDVADDFPPILRSWPKDLLTVLAARAPIALRAARRVGPEAVIAALGSGTASPIAPLGIVLEGFRDVRAVPGFETGDFEIQDEGAQILALFALSPDACAPLLSDRPCRTNRTNGKPPALPAAPKRALTIVDACAGAGGKTLAIADLLDNKGRIFAYDVSKRRLLALRARARRAGVTSVKTALVEEGREVEARFEDSADIVLVDAPCSGLGVLRRNPDAKWRLDAAAFERLEALQARLLAEYAKLVRPGGRLVYGVCTFREEETTRIARAFAAAHPSFEPGPGGFLGPGPSDGFFMQAFTRTR